jgi:ABC-type multidrug transport system ATPase subunit
MISVKALAKAYRRRTVLDGLALDAQGGDVTLLVGPNGAGKTTLVKVLAGVVRPDSGSALINGIDVVRHRRAAQRGLSFLPQAVTFDPRLNCRQLLTFYARLRGVATQRIDNMLQRFGLQDDAKKRAGELSGGLRQRLGLAVLLLPDAPVLLLDEPDLSLDPPWRGRLQQILRDEARLGKTILVTTHLLGEWEGIADRCLVCEDGAMKREIDPHRLREQFKS